MTLRYLRRRRVAAALALCGFSVCFAPARAAGTVHKLVLQVSDNIADKMNGALSIAANVSRHYSGVGDGVDIVIVAFGEGLHMLRADTSPVKERVASFGASMPNVAFVACEMTLRSMIKAKGENIRLLDGVATTPAGVVKIIDLAEQGYAVVRP